ALAARYPHDARVALELAASYRAASRAAECAAEGRRALGLDPGAAAAYGHIAWCSLAAGDAETAVAMARAYAATKGRGAEGSEVLGDVLMMIGKYGEAREAYRRAGEGGNAAAGAKAVLVEVNGTGRCVTGVRLAGRLSRTDPGSPVLARAWAQAGLACNDYTAVKEAEGWAKKHGAVA